MEVTRIDIYDFKVIVSKTDFMIIKTFATQKRMSIEQAFAFIIADALDFRGKQLVEKET